MTTKSEIALRETLNLSQRLRDVVAKALSSSPTLEQERELVSRRARLEQQQAELKNRLQQVVDQSLDVYPPTDEQVENIKALTDEVEQLRSRARQAAAVLTATSQVIRAIDALMSGMGPGKP